MKQTVELKAGDKFNRLTVIKLDHIKEIHFDNRKKNIEYYLCKCDCGNEVLVEKNHLKYNHTKSCGCLKQEKDKLTKNYTHKLSKTKLYGVWSSMKDRCLRKKNIRYKDYGGRGIKVCDEWLNKDDGFLSFYSWAMNNGYKEGLTIDRIDNNSNYEPSNCRWVGRKEQSNNTRKNVYLKYNNINHTITEWADIMNIKRNTLNIGYRKYGFEYYIKKYFNRLCLK